MPSPDNQNQTSRGIDWPGIVRIMLAQVLVLLALSGALIFYLNWSSDASWADFIGANQSSASEPAQQRQSWAPVQTATVQSKVR